LISGFNGSDMVSLSGFGGTYTPGIALSGGNTVFSLSDGSQITVQNYTNWGANQFRIS